MVAPGYAIQAEPKRYQQSLQVAKRDGTASLNNLDICSLNIGHGDVGERTERLFALRRMSFSDGSPDFP